MPEGFWTRPVQRWLTAERHSSTGALVRGVMLIWVLGTTTALAAEDLQGTFTWGSVEEAVEPVPHLLHETSASFAWEGNLYRLYATDAPGTPARQVLEEAIKELAPGLALDCFYRRTAGSWDDLAKAGIGDPRAAVPTGYLPTELQLSFYAPPSGRCEGVVAAGDLPVLFTATFEDKEGQRLHLQAAWTETSAGTERGAVSAEGAAWRNGRLSFSLAFDGKGPGEESVTALALALDPGFEAACQRRTEELSDARLSQLGLPEPLIPEGFHPLSAHRSVSQASVGCTEGPADPGKLDLAWVFVSAEGTFLQAGVSRDTAAAAEPEGVMVGEDYVRWTDDQGNAYYVYSPLADDGSGLSLADLFAVARSLDPAVALPQN